MIPVRSAARAHRKHLPSPGFIPGTSFTVFPRWQPMTGPEPSTWKVAVQPSVADAVAKYFLNAGTTDDVIANESLIPSSVILLPDGNVPPENTHLRYPRFLYCVNWRYATDQAALGDELAAGYSALADMGVGVTATSSAGISVNHHHTSASFTAWTGVTDVSGGGPYPAVVPIPESGYAGGDLMIAVVVRSDVANNRPLVTSFPTLGATYFGMSSGSDPNYGNSGYVAIETAGPDTLWFHPAMATGDLVTKGDNAPNYRRFTIRYYVPDEPVQAPSGGSFATTYSGMVLLVDPEAPVTVFDPSTPGDLSTKMLADAVSFFA